MSQPAPEATAEPLDFIREIAHQDVLSGKHPAVVTRFPPEPNGYLHIGHAKSICLNFGLAAENAGSRCHLRFDDTNPAREDIEYVESIQEDVKWLGFDWGENLFHASDYFDQIHGFALELIGKGLAYVCDQTVEEVRANRGTLTEPGTDSPFRTRSVEENLDLFARMKAGEFADGTRTLRAKIDMASPNMNLRDPVIYRIKKVPHDRTGDKWCIYPTYDMAHGFSDALEGITHSICTLEFEAHRPLYDWLIENVSAPCHPRQIEFSRLNLTYTVMSKRKLLELVEKGLVDGWDDPRMPTISGLRRRGFPAAGIRNFCQRIGVTKYNSVTDMSILEAAVREELNRTSPRFLGVLRPLKFTITNWPEGKVEMLEAANHPEDPEAGKRQLPFTGEIVIEQDDFMEVPAPKYFRLAPGRTARLRHGYNVTVGEVIKDADGKVVELRGPYDPESRDSKPKKGVAVIHWLSAAHAAPAEVRLYDRLLTVPDPNAVPEGVDWISTLNPDSLEILGGSLVERASTEQAGTFQFERLGYFCLDSKHSQPGRPVINRTVTLKDTWAVTQAKV
ncbi:MAG: glutamine--tRNA ligase/YqeY domain fusion protein [Verrucomicrobiota bacterium]